MTTTIAADTQITLTLPAAIVDLILNTLGDHVPYKQAAVAINTISTQAQEQVRAINSTQAQEQGRALPPAQPAQPARKTRDRRAAAADDLGGDRPVPALTRAQRRAAEREAAKLKAKHEADLQGTPAPVSAVKRRARKLAA